MTGGLRQYNGERREDPARCREKSRARRRNRRACVRVRVLVRDERDRRLEPLSSKRSFEYLTYYCDYCDYEARHVVSLQNRFHADGVFVAHVFNIISTYTPTHFGVPASDIALTLQTSTDTSHSICARVSQSAGRSPALAPTLSGHNTGLA